MSSQNGGMKQMMKLSTSQGVPGSSSKGMQGIGISGYTIQNQQQQPKFVGQSQGASNSN